MSGRQRYRLIVARVANSNFFLRNAADDQSRRNFARELQLCFPLPSGFAKLQSYKALVIEQPLTFRDQKNAAVVVLPAVGGGQLKSPALRRWIARGSLKRLQAPEELLSRIVDTLNMPCPQEGLGALRMWGQTGERPTVWIAAADPVYLEPRLDQLCLHALEDGDLPTSDLRPLVDHLQKTLQGDATIGFVRLGSCSYLRASQPIATAAVPAYVVHRDRPNDYMPRGQGSAGYRKLVSEVEMSLHDHEVNLQRQSNGLQPVNCFWFWGGGYAPLQHVVPLPPLFANDPLLRGYWHSKAATAATWPNDMAACLDNSDAGFVAVAAANDDPESLEHCLYCLRAALQTGRLSRLQLIFRDGVEADVQRKHKWRLWRRKSELLA